MRLVKLQGLLKELKIPYTYNEKSGCGEVDFDFNGKHYLAWEVTGINGNKPHGIYANIGSVSTVRSQNTLCHVLRRIHHEAS